MTSVMAMPFTSAIGTTDILALGFNPRMMNFLGINPEVMTSVMAMPFTSAIGTTDILALGFNPRRLLYCLNCIDVLLNLYFHKKLFAFRKYKRRTIPTKSKGI
jgi:hypothetical protein